MTDQAAEIPKPAPQKISRRSFLGILGKLATLAVAGTAITHGETIRKAGEVISAVNLMLTPEQKTAIDQMNQTDASQIIHYLTTGPDGANWRNRPYSVDSSEGQNGLVYQRWDPNQTYPVEAIPVIGNNPIQPNLKQTDEWYFRTTKVENGKAVDGLFSWSGNFTLASSEAPK